jgi:hypothetical protein
LNLIVAKAIKHAFACFLGEITIESFGGKPLPRKGVGQFRSANACAGKNQSALDIFVFQDPCERGDFIGLPHEVIALFNGNRGHLTALNGHRLWCTHILIGQTADRRWNGGGKERGLTCRWGLG